MRAKIVATLRLNLTLVFDFGDSSYFGFKASSSFNLTRLSISLPRAVVPFVKPGGPADKKVTLENKNIRSRVENNHYFLGKMVGYGYHLFLKLLWLVINYNL